MSGHMRQISENNTEKSRDLMIANGENEYIFLGGGVSRKWKHLYADSSRKARRVTLCVLKTDVGSSTSRVRHYSDILPRRYGQ